MTGRREVLELPLSHQSPVDTWPSRPVVAADAEGLAILLYAAFRGTVDDEGETFADAMGEIDKTLAGDYGRPLLDCSFVIEEGEFLSSACVITWFEHHNAPLVVFTMTRPEAQRRGLSRFLLQQSVNALLGKGYDRLTLVVSEANQPARNLYASIGFRPVD